MKMMLMRGIAGRMPYTPCFTFQYLNHDHVGVPLPTSSFQEMSSISV